MEKHEIRSKILVELANKWVPDLKFLYSSESMEIIPEILNEFLEEEKTRFLNLINTPNEKISFSIFEEEDKLSYLFSLISHHESVNSSDRVREIIDNFRSPYIEFANEVAYSRRFYEMHVILRDSGVLDVEQKRIFDLAIRNFETNGIHLPEDKKTRLKEINQLTSKLSFDFGNNLLDSQKEFFYIFEDDSSILELPQDVLKNAQNLASADWIKGFKFTSDHSSYINIMKYCTDSQVRKHFFDSRKQFASSWKFDNRPLILELLKLRQEQARLLWFNNYWELSLVDKMALSPEQVISQEEAITSRAKVKALKEIEELKNYFNLEELNPWDLSFYTRILKEQKYQVNDKILREYFEFDSVIEWMLNVAKNLYDLEFNEINIDLYNEEVKTIEIIKSWELKAYLILDVFYRNTKSSWAWANLIRWKEYLPWKERVPIVFNVFSFQKSSSNTLLNYIDVSTMFHEFGHAIHQTLTDSKYSSLWGNWVEWDFVELPSQIMENWCEWEWLASFAKHYKTNNPITKELIKKLEKLKTFMTGNSVLNQNIYSKVDMMIHTQEVPSTVEELDKKVLEIINSTAIFKSWKDNKFHAGFSHIFDWWYAAWFYSYERAEIIEADIFSEFKKNWIFDKETWEKFYNTILSKWTTKPALELFKDFKWREPALDAFFEKMGF